MIGGRDIIIPTARGAEALDLAVRAVTRLWGPNVVLEDGVSGEGFRRYGDIDFAGRREILAFRDAESARLWDELGADPSLDGTLIHFLLSKGELTVAVDAEPSTQIASFVESLQRSLAQDLFASRVEFPTTEAA
ncbi:MAG TPA: hypothetical protein VFC46_11445 [Humisphaera sp.]|nr:hypothetical protein [Humisphaera sp.]